MRIGITCYSTYGGSGVLATELGKALAQRGHQVHFITKELPFRLRHDFNENIFFHPVDSLEYPLFGESPYTLNLSAKMAEVFRLEKLDLLHVHYAIPHATSALLAAQMLEPLTVPIVTTLHGTDITIVGKDPSLFDITRFSINRSTVVTAVSDFLKAKTEEEFRPKIPVQRIHNFVDTDFFQRHKSPCRKRWAQDGDVVFVHLSNFRPVKRSYDAVEAFAKIHQKVPNSVLLMAGEGPLISDCRRKAAEWNIADKVHFLGKQEDLVTLLCLSDIMLFPSDTESFGLAAIEAASMEIPVIATNVGGLPEAIVHEETGFLVDVGDTDAMARYGIELAQNPDFRMRMGQAGRKDVVERFRPDVIIPHYELAYEDAIARARKENPSP
jgi:N-acetyl-alpha-D-glucosaminyl L-malate synthase BshA